MDFKIWQEVLGSRWRELGIPFGQKMISDYWPTLEPLHVEILSYREPVCHFLSKKFIVNHS
jgi:hypothetical protein